ncbi:hypothetical protein F4781DRAFT_152500 [Annulohypoxylon bovei var. microspora]|nr:hypothetical protein F4781DRAFT_152500 [Annulohypoxylon bovei var. microspora]
MSQLKYVRKDSTHVVLTEHPDYIHPRDLAQELTARYGDKKFKISLRRNIYVIYINIEVAGSQFVHPYDAEDSERDIATRDANECYITQLEDTRLAEKVLSKARVSKFSQ